MIIYKKKINKISYISLALAFVLIILLTYEKLNNGTYYGAIFLVSITVIEWITRFYFPTYTITEQQLIIKTLFEKNEIDINSIRKIEKNKISIGRRLLRPLEKGLIISYNKYDEIHLSPKQEDDFINELIKINPNISI